MVEVKDGEKLANEEVKAIANLVLKACPAWSWRISASWIRP
jgi:flagellar biosynthesis/type III secretory pathway M-ring protein FliF/YscJ